MVDNLIAIKVRDVGNADAECFGKLVECLKGWVARARFDARDVGLAQAGGDTELFLRQAGFAA